MAEMKDAMKAKDEAASKTAGHFRDFATEAGLVFKIAGRVPTRGEIIRHDSGLEFEILDSDPRRVKRLRINIGNLKATSAESDDEKSSG